MSELRIGCSGWSYDDWRGPFYPEGLKAKDRLAYYATRFSTAEINASFYRLPSEAAVGAWRDQTPEGFLFAWKASRYITHNKRLLDCADSVELVFGRMAGLEAKFGPVLFQLPPSMKCDLERLAAFARLLPKDRRCVFEFRHPSWYVEALYDLLREHGLGFCVSDHHHAPSPWEATADFAYIRAHGPGGRYRGRYPETDLEAMAGHIRHWRAGRRDVFCYFDNDIKSAAPRDAEALIGLLR